MSYVPFSLFYYEYLGVHRLRTYQGMSCPVWRIFWDSPHFHGFHRNLPMLHLTMWRATIMRFARQAGFSSTVATQLPFFRRKFRRVNYQARWSTYGMWYAENGLRSSSLSISGFAEFLTFLFKHKGTALSTVKGYRALLSAFFKFTFRGSILSYP